MTTTLRNFIFSVILFSLTGGNLLAQAPSKTSPRPQDYVPSSKVISSRNGEFDKQSGIPRSLWNINAGPYNGTHEQIAQQFLRENTSLLHLRNELSDISMERTQTNFGISHVTFHQNLNGVPVFRSDVVVSVNAENYVTFVVNNYKPNVNLSTIPSLSKQTALTLAKEFLQLRGKTIDEPTSELMVYAEGEPPALCYRISIFNEDPLGDWEVFVDALNGSIISSTDRAVYEKPKENSQKKSQGTGYIFDPDPLQSAQQFYNTTGYVDGNDADTPELTAQRKLVTLKDITFSSGTYKLQGPFCKLLDFESPTDIFANPTEPDSFRFTRFQQGFEEVMVYFWIDSSQRYIQSLGFDNIQNLPIECDPHGLSGADNSHYIPSSNRLAWGEGGSDDDEDLDVIWHEYGHAIHYGINSNWGGGEAGALGEGFGDYWAGSYSRAYNDFSKDFVFTWDGGLTSGGTGAIWAGRKLNDTRNYPPNGVGGLQIHDAGQIWSAVLLLIGNDVGREVMDKLVLKSHFYLGTSPTMRLNAQAVIQADRDLYGGAHLQQLINWFGQRQFVNPNDFIAQISHTPLTDTEDMNGPYVVTALVVPGVSPIDSNTVKVIFGRTNSFTDTVLMNRTPIANEYRGNITGNGSSTTYRYYIVATDSAGTTVSHPANAPTGFHSFRVGFDTVAPVITHSTLNNQGRSRWPAKVNASVTDNLGIDSVWVDYYKNSPSNSGSFVLSHQIGNTYSGFFDIDMSQIAVGDSLFYKVVAKDNSINGNITTSPESGFHSFVIIATRGNVLVINDDSLFVTKYDSEKGNDSPSENLEANRSPNLFFTTLTEAGYNVEVQPIATVDVGTFNDYDIIVSSSGVRIDPLRNVDVRAALVARAQNGGKIFVEGGEVGYDFRWQSTTELDKDFRQYVLHDSSWHADNSAGSATFVVPEHSVFNAPNTLAPPLTFTTRTTYGDKDAMMLMPDDPYARRLGGWNASGQELRASIIIWNNNADTTTAQIIFLAFSVGSITDSTVAKQLIENCTEFLSGQGTVGVTERTSAIPSSFELYQNYPNPFNPATVISFGIPVQAEVTLRIYNVLGQTVTTLVNATMNAGSYAVEWNAATVSSGVYYYRLQATTSTQTSPFTLTRKMVVTK